MYTAAPLTPPPHTGDSISQRLADAFNPDLSPQVKAAIRAAEQRKNAQIQAIKACEALVDQHGGKNAVMIAAANLQRAISTATLAAPLPDEIVFHNQVLYEALYAALVSP